MFVRAANGGTHCGDGRFRLLERAQTKWAAAGVINQCETRSFPCHAFPVKNEPARGKPARHCGSGGLC